MLIKAISDTHNQHEFLKDLECDILIHCGDACVKGNYTEGLNFLMWYVKQPAKYKILVPGNHDKKLMLHLDLIKLSKDLGIHVLNDDLFEINGIRFYGVSKTFKDQANPKDKSTPLDRLNAWKNIPVNVDYLITHMPPKYILDRNQQGNPIGCPFLTKKIREVTPSVHLFGHVHEHGNEVVNLSNTKFYNCANMNREYILERNTPRIILHKEKHAD